MVSLHRRGIGKQPSQVEFGLSLPSSHTLSRALSFRGPAITQNNPDRLFRQTPPRSGQAIPLGASSNAPDLSASACVTPFRRAKLAQIACGCPCPSKSYCTASILGSQTRLDGRCLSTRSADRGGIENFLATFPRGKLFHLLPSLYHARSALR